VVWPVQEAAWGRFLVLADPDGRSVVPAKMRPVTLLPLAAGYRHAASGGEFGISHLSYSSSSGSFNLTRHIRRYIRKRPQTLVIQGQIRYHVRRTILLPNGCGSCLLYPMVVKGGTA